MQSRATRDSSTAQTAFYVSKVKRLHAYFLAQLIKAVLYPLFTFCAVCVRFLVYPGAQLSAVCLTTAYRTKNTTKRGIKYLLSITSLNYWAYIIIVIQEVNKSCPPVVFATDERQNIVTRAKICDSPENIRYRFTCGALACLMFRRALIFAVVACFYFTFYSVKAFQFVVHPSTLFSVCA